MTRYTDEQLREFASIPAEEWEAIGHEDVPALCRELLELRAEIDRLRHAGHALATCAFNLKQRDHLTECERRSLAESQEAWDRTVRGES